MSGAREKPSAYESEGRLFESAWAHPGIPRISSLQRGVSDRRARRVRTRSGATTHVPTRLAGTELVHYLVHGRSRPASGNRPDERTSLLQRPTRYSARST